MNLNNNKLLKNEDLYRNCGDMIKDNVLEIQKQIFAVRGYLSNRKREIIKEIRAHNGDRIPALEATKDFYNHALTELVKIEEACEEFLMEIKIDLLTEIKCKLQPASHVSLEKVREAYRRFKCVFESEEFEKSRYFWRNVSKHKLRDTEKILAEPRQIKSTEFDESDLKFKQELNVLRTKMFSVPKDVDLRYKEEDLTKDLNVRRRTNDRSSTGKEIIETIRKAESFALPSIKDEFPKVNHLKFVEGEFSSCDVWLRMLDVHGRQLTSKWLLVICPQIKAIMIKRRVPAIHLSPQRTFNFLSKIPENGIKFLLLKEDIIPLLANDYEGQWFKNWKSQFKTIEGKDIAATLIQSLWRGHRVRENVRRTERLYVAASVLWFHWISRKKKQQMHRRYLQKMLVSLNFTRNLGLKLSTELNEFIKQPHVILHLPSLGYAFEVRQNLIPKRFLILQNTMPLKFSFVRNPMSEVIYILPVEVTQDLLTMYMDLVESVDTDDSIMKRITFLALSESKIFQDRSVNISRILHCSEETLKIIRNRIAKKPSYFLPWIVDECDVRLSENLEVPLLSPDMELQRELLNKSKVSKLVENLGFSQPVHLRDINDYGELCARLAELIIMNTEICTWLIKMNFGLQDKNFGTFVINHISVPFMPLLRRERERHGEKWKVNPRLRVEFLKNLYQQLPKVVSTTTRLPSIYTSWKDFYVHLQKFGCLLQAVPMERDSKNIVVTLFIPGRGTGEKPKWTGTADRIYLESSYSTFAYMIPETSMDVRLVEPIANRFAEAVQNMGYFGYLTLDCYCYSTKREEKVVVLIMDVRPYYGYVQHYVDWIKFAINGRYRHSTNTLNADVAVLPEARRRKSSYMLTLETPKWNETTERYAIAICQLYHAGFSLYRWPQLRALLEDSDISYDSTMKQGSHFVLHDGESKDFGTMVAIGPAMATTSSMTKNSLKKLHYRLMKKSKDRSKTNLNAIADFFAKLSLSYSNLSADVCQENY